MNELIAFFHSIYLATSRSVNSIMNTNLIIKLNSTTGLQASPEKVKINKLSSSISPLNFIKLLKEADNKVNPRIANVNKITKGIHETLKNSPELYFYKSKGLLIATQSCKILDRNRVELSFEDPEHEGIMDGGHNTFAVGIYIISELFGTNIKKWDDCKMFWDANYDELLTRFKEREEEFKFSIPIEIITPNEEDGALEEYYENLSEICSARNNNVQLTETSKGNQVGLYDLLKDLLDGEFDVIWKAGYSGKIKSEDVISLATIPLIFLRERGKIPSDIKSLNKISVYSQKSKCVEFFNDVVGHESISKYENGKYVLQDELVKSALHLTKDILKFFDRMYIEFPNLYHDASPGKFGRISAVVKTATRVPFLSTDIKSDYQYPFGFFVPLIAGLTELMKIENNAVRWKINPNQIDLSKIDLSQYVNIIKLVSFDPQKVGKQDVFYKEAENAFGNL
ncbi:hypothetical protein [Mucilaginibacter sp. 44-25]|uniref:hypothetical protein n=1 Tax=Mucilaginibacter sp. 44-25 TaxID=1895794 RepID=UPI0025D9AC4E|nr:hypothetical protein [Mucilaginibacter sp. 44-25]